MKKLFLPLAALALVVTPAMAGDDKNKEESTEQSATEEKDSGIVEKAIKLKAIDKVGNDGIIEKGAKVKLLTK
jgi:hypothetical protein